MCKKVGGHSSGDPPSSPRLPRSPNTAMKGFIVYSRSKKSRYLCNESSSDRQETQEMQEIERERSKDPPDWNGVCQEGLQQSVSEDEGIYERESGEREVGAENGRDSKGSESSFPRQNDIKVTGETSMGGEGRIEGNRFSYKDKLLSIGESGFLEVAGWDEDAMRGWKQYFAKMSEAKEVSEEDFAENSESENEDSSWQKTGKFPKLSMTADEFQMWCKPYLNSLIVKLMGKTFGVGFMRQMMERMWVSRFVLLL